MVVRRLLIVVVPLLLAFFFELFLANRVLIARVLFHGAMVQAAKFSFGSFLAYALFAELSAFLIFGADKWIAWVVRWRYALVAGLFVVLVACQVSMSSIGIWDALLSDTVNPAQQYRISGDARKIRSDEWLVNTPYCLSQAQQEGYYPAVNPDMASDGLNMMITPGLVWNITATGRPEFWGYFLMGRAYGFSWSWCLPFLLLFLTSFEVARFLTGRNDRLAMVAAFWIAFSPPIQWWMQGVTGIIHPILWSQAILVSLLYFLRCRPDQLWRKAGYALLLFIALLAFIFNLYPAWQIPIFYLTLLIAAFICRTYGTGRTARQRAIEIGMIAAVVLATAGIVGWFYGQVQGVLRILQSTVYPGARFFTGGDVPLSMLAKDVAAFLLPYRSPTGALGNAPEASAFLALLPFVIVAFVPFWRRAKQHKGLALALLILLCIQVLWITVGFPAFLARATFFYLTSGSRMMIPMGLTATYLLLIMTNSFQTEGAPGRLVQVLTGVAAFAVYLAAGLSAPIQPYLGVLIAVVSAALFGLLSWSIAAGNRRWNAAVMLMVVFMVGVPVNPVIHGLSPIDNKVTSQAIRQIDQQTPGQKWLGLENLYSAPLLIANGAHAVNGVQYYPDLALWHPLDTDRKYEEVYNRYAHVIVKLTDTTTKFELVTPDSFTVLLNVDDLKKMGITYLLAKTELTSLATQHTRFTLLYSNKTDGMGIYRVVYQ